MPAQSTGAPLPQSHPYTGMWVTADGHIRHEFLPSGRQDEARAITKVPIRAATLSLAIISATGATRALPPTAHSSMTTRYTTPE